MWWYGFQCQKIIHTSERTKKKKKKKKKQKLKKPQKLNKKENHPQEGMGKGIVVC